MVGNPTAEVKENPGLTVAQLAQMVVRLNDGDLQITTPSDELRADLQKAANIGDNDFLGLTDSMIRKKFPGVSDAEIKQNAIYALAFADKTFNGDVRAAMQAVVNQRDNPAFQGNFVTMVQDGSLAQTLKGGGVQVASISPVTATDATAVAATAEKTAKESGLNGILSGLFNQLGMDGASIQNSELGQLLKQILSFFEGFGKAGSAGKTHSVSNDPNAFAGVRTPDGNPVPSQANRGTAANSPEPPEQVAANVNGPPNLPVAGTVPA